MTHVAARSPHPAAACLALMMAFTSPGWAQTPADTQDGQLWTQVLATGTLSRNWRTHLELQPRVFDNVSELGLTIVRTAIGRQVSPRVTVWGGHAWVPRSFGPVTRHEHRLWQQVSLTLPRAGRWSPSARVRLEQRWLDQWADPSHRLRIMMRAQRPLGAGPWHIALYDEVMTTLETTTPGPARGYDRNRLWGGLGRRLSSSFTAELGYMWENSTIRGPGQRNEHIALAVLNVAWPRRP